MPTTEYDQLRELRQQLELFRDDLVAKIASHDGDEKLLCNLHHRVSGALKALKG